MSKLKYVLYVILIFVTYAALCILMYFYCNRVVNLSEQELFDNLVAMMPIFSTCHVSIASFFAVVGWLLLLCMWIIYTTCIIVIISDRLRGVKNDT